MSDGGIRAWRTLGTDDALKLAKFRRSSIAGRRDAYMASIHCEDVAAAVACAFAADTGVYNVADDSPMTRGDYLDAFASAFDIKAPKPIPGPLVKLGGAGADGLIASQRVSNDKFRTATGWQPRYPDAGAGWVAEATSRRDGTS